MPTRKVAVFISMFCVWVIWLFGFGMAESRGEGLTLSLSSLSLGTSPPLLAQRKGFYAQEGLDVNLTIVKSGTPAVQALLGGSVQLAATGPEDFIRATDAGTPTVIVGGVLSSLTHSLMAGSKFKQVNDLRGGKVAVSGLTGSVTYALKFMLAKNHLRYPKDYLIIQIGGPAVRLAAPTKPLRSPPSARWEPDTGHKPKSADTTA